MIGLILAAGKGTRMKPYSNAINKEMSLIGNYPVIDYNVKAIARAGVKDILVVLGESKWQIFEYLRDGSQYNVNLSYLYQDMSKGKGTAKAIEAAKPWIDDDFMVVYGDSFFYPLNFFKNEVDCHAREKADVTLGAYFMEAHKEYGVLKIRGTAVIDILEKASANEVEEARSNGMYAVNSGPLIFKKDIFDYIGLTGESPSGEYWITDTIRLMIGDKRKVIAYRIPSDVFWRDIGHMEHRVESEAFMLKLRENGDIGINSNR